jgi:ATP-binding cassette subfamily C protein LapB
VAGDAPEVIDGALGGPIGAAALRRLFALWGRRLDLAEVAQALEQAGAPRFAGGKEALGALGAALERLGAGGTRLAATKAGVLREEHLPALVEHAGRCWVMREIRGARCLLDPGEGKPTEVAAEELGAAYAIWLEPPARPGGEEKGPSMAGGLIAAALGKRRRLLAEVAIATLLTSILTIGTSVFTFQVYNRVIPSFSYPTLWALAGVVGVLIVFDFILRLVRARLLDRVSRDIDEEVSVAVFRALTGVRLDARPRAVGTLAAQVAGLELARAFFTSTVLFTFAEIPFAVLFILLIAFIGGPLAWIYTGVAVAAVIAGLIAYFRLRRISREQLQAGFRRNGLLV